MRKTTENHSKTQAEEPPTKWGQIYHWGYMLYSVEHKRKGARLE
jgi:hypothetical protein